MGGCLGQELETLYGITIHLGSLVGFRAKVFCGVLFFLYRVSLKICCFNKILNKGVCGHAYFPVLSLLLFYNKKILWNL